MVSDSNPLNFVTLRRSCMVIIACILTYQISNIIRFSKLQTHVTMDVGCNDATSYITVILFIFAIHAFSPKSGPTTWGQLKDNITIECSREEHDLMIFNDVKVNICKFISWSGH